MSRSRHTPDDKTALLEKFLASGASAPALCHAEGIGYQTFQKWRRKPADRGVTPAPRPEFIQVELGSRPIPQPVPSVLVELELGGGLWILMKRLERGRFCLPRSASDSGPSIAIKPKALEMLLSGIDLKDGLQRAWYELPVK